MDDVRYRAEIVERLCHDSAYQELLKVLCRNPALLDEFESDVESERLCDLLESPAP